MRGRGEEPQVRIAGDREGLASRGGQTAGFTLKGFIPKEVVCSKGCVKLLQEKRG